MKKTREKTFHEKLAMRHLDENGNETFAAIPQENGEIIVRRPNREDQRILIYAKIDSGKMSICNLTTGETRDTFRNINNTCAEEWRSDVDFISR